MPRLWQCPASGFVPIVVSLGAWTAMASIPAIEQLVSDLFQRQTAAGGMLRPRDISAVEDICIPRQSD
jgi:hypothetical protein